MHLAANTQLVRNRTRLGTGLYVASLLLLLAGWWLGGRDPNADQTVLAASWAAMATGMIVWFVALSQLRRWGPRQRQEVRLADAIRGLDDRYKLYAYLSSSLPNYLLVGPGGVFALVARPESGQVVCQADRWRQPGRSLLKSFFEPGLGNPSLEAQQQGEKLRRLLEEEGFGDVPSGTVVVFTNDRVKLQLESCSANVTRVKGLKELLLRLAGKGRQVALPTGRIREIQSAFDRRLEAAGRWR